MITINNRNELENFLYGADSTSPETLVGIARIGGELLAAFLVGRPNEFLGPRGQAREHGGIHRVGGCGGGDEEGR